MDNFKLDITGEGPDVLAKAMDIAMSQYTCIRAYSADKQRLILYWSDNVQVEGAHPFPFEMDSTGAADFARRWLETAVYGPQPDHDGDNSKGWRLYNVDAGFQVAAVIEPRWACYGK